MDPASLGPGADDADVAAAAAALRRRAEQISQEVVDGLAEASAALDELAVAAQPAFDFHVAPHLAAGPPASSSFEDLVGGPLAGPLPDGPAFAVGPPTRPDLTFDEDFPGEPASPGVADWLARARWRSQLFGGELVRSDLDDATTLYRHYWEGDGAPVRVDYAEGYREDGAVRETVDVLSAGAARWADLAARSGAEGSFSLSSDAAQAGDVLGRYPADTENWQKTLGGYQVWTSADVDVSDGRVRMEVTVHAEDRYNFNAGQNDIATEAPDDANVRFAQVGWAEGFQVTGEVTQVYEWDVGEPPPPGALPESTAEPERHEGTEDREDRRDSSSGATDRPSSRDGTGPRRGG